MCTVPSGLSRRRHGAAAPPCNSAIACSRHPTIIAIVKLNSVRLEIRHRLLATFSLGHAFCDEAPPCCEVEFMTAPNT
jgi:hypothetical protein